MNWQMYYADGVVYTDQDGLPENSPKDFLLFIYQQNPSFGRSLVPGDYFVFKDRWYGHDLYGLVDQLKHNLDSIRAVRPGFYTDDETYQRIMASAILD